MGQYGHFADLLLLSHQQLSPTKAEADSPSLEHPIEALRRDRVSAREHLWRVRLGRLFFRYGADEDRVVSP